MNKSGFNRRTRFFLEWCARLAFIAYAVQVMAIDHWHVDAVPQGTPQPSHSAHCHGDLSSCSDAGDITGTLAAAVATFVPPAPRLDSLAQLHTSPMEAFIASPDRPPKAA